MVKVEQRVDRVTWGTALCASADSKTVSAWRSADEDVPGRFERLQEGSA